MMFPAKFKISRAFWQKYFFQDGCRIKICLLVIVTYTSGIFQLDLTRRLEYKLKSILKMATLETILVVLTFSRWLLRCHIGCNYNHNLNNSEPTQFQTNIELNVTKKQNNIILLTHVLRMYFN